MQIPRIDILKLLDTNAKIFNFLTKENEIIRFKEPTSIRWHLYKACMQGNVELVHWLTRNEIEDENGLIYKIDYKNKQAAVVDMKKKLVDIFIPYSVINKNAFGFDEEFIVTTIVEECFVDNFICKTVKFPQNSELQIIKERAFYERPIESITIPSKVEFIGESAFQNCVKLNSFTFLENSELNTIEKFTFCMSSIESIFIPSNVTKIKEFAFSKTISLNKIDFGLNSKLIEIENSAFSCSFIAYIKIPQHVTKLGNCAFSSCPNLKCVEFSEKSELKIIGKHCFDGASIEKIAIPSKVTIIESHAFDSCKNLKIVEISENSELEIIEDNAFSYTLIEYFYIPQNVTKIGCYAFGSKIKKIQFARNSKLKTIKSIFSFSDIQDVTIPPLVTQIEPYDFQQCDNLKSVHIPDNSELKYIDECAFFFSSIESLSIPSKLIEFKDGWCDSTSKLNKIIIKESNPYYIFKDDKFLLGKTDQKSNVFDILIFSRRDIKEAIIPSTIKIISSCSFESCKKLKTVDFSNSSELHFIGNSSFRYTNIENISIPPHVTSIECFTFSGCKNLKTVHIPDNSELKYIDKCAFSNSSIESLSIPSKLIEFKDGWCDSTSKLNKIIIKESNPYYIFKDDKFLLGKTDQKSDIFDILIFSRRDIKEAIIPSTIKIISSCSFESCKKLKTVDFSNAYELLSIESCAFQHCTQLKHVEINENSKLKIIRKNAFAWSSIVTISLPSHVEEVEESTFYYCGKLKTLKLPENSELKTIGKEAFSNTSISCFSLPPHVKSIGDSAFSNCMKLQIIEIHGNSVINFLHESLFDNSTLEIIMVQANFKLTFKH